MANYKTAFCAVMDGMKCNDLMNDEWAQYNFRQVFEAIRIAELVEPGESRFYSTGSQVGLVEHSTAQDAHDWAHDTHESQKPNAYAITRLSMRGYRVESIF